MEQHELNRMFDALAPTQEQEQAVLDRLLRTEREVIPMKKLKKLTVIGIAAALMVISCAAAVVTGIDKRLADYFGAGEKTELLAEGVVPVGERHTYDNGWTVEIVQLAADRYSLVALVQVTAPEGVRLDGDCYIDLHSEIVPKEGGGVGSYVCGSIQLSDEDPEDNRLAFLWHRGPTSFSEGGSQSIAGHSVTLSPQRFRQALGNLRADFPQNEWSVTAELPAEDSGSAYVSHQTVTAGGKAAVVDEIYVSPVSVAYHMTGDTAEALSSPAFSDWKERTAVYTADGGVTAAKEVVSINCNLKDGSGMFVFRLKEMIDPAQVAGVTILGQDLPLDGLVPAE